MPERIRLADVAARAGVSRATASLVLRGQGRVAEATRARVLAAMDELGYVYDRLAAAMRAERVPVVGVLVSDIANPFFAELLLGLQDELHAAGYLPLLASSGDDLTRQDELMRLLREHRVAALALAPVGGTSPGVVDDLRRWGLEHVLLTLPIDGARTWLVTPDDVRGAALAAEHLIGVHGCRTLLALGGSDRVANGRARLAGVRQAARAAGLAPEAVSVLEHLEDDPTGLRLGRRAAAGELADGVVCFSDVHATGLLRALREAGRAGEVAVTGYDDIPTAALWEPPLTTVATHAADLGRRAAASLLRRLEGDGLGAQESPAEPVGLDEPVEQVEQVEQVEPELVVRASCGCPGP